MSKRQSVLILAAGHGKRMGGPKVFTRHGAQSFLQRILARCAESGADVTLTVDPLFRVQLEAELRAMNVAAPTLVDADGARPMLATVQAGLAAGGFERGFWLWPVDAPFISAAGWALATRAAAADASAILKLRVENRTGHPIWFPGWAVALVAGGEWSDGLLGFLNEHEQRVSILHLEHEVLSDFNTRQQLEQAAPESGGEA